jgi:hypothetical protein
MATISTQQVLDFVLEQISKDFNIDHDTLKNKFSSVDNIYNAIQESTKPKAKRVLKKAPVIETPKEEPVITKEEPVITKKKVLRKVKAVQEPIVVTNEPTTVTNEPTTVTNEPTTVTNEPTKVTNEPTDVPSLVIDSTLPVKKKIIRKATKVVEQMEVPVEPIATPSATVEEPEPVLPTKKKVIRKVTKVVEEPIVVVEEKIVPKRIQKKASSNPEIVTETKKKSKKNVELVEFGTDENSMEGVDEIEANVYVDTILYNDEDSDSLVPREVNGKKYYIDCSNYVYDFESQDLIGKLNEKGDKIIFLSDFPIEQN